MEEEIIENLVGNQVSRAERLQRRLAALTEEEPKKYIRRKYKPSPQKKHPIDGRGQWRKVRRIRESEAEIEKNTWRLFNKQDILDHQKYNTKSFMDPDWRASKDDIEAMNQEEEEEISEEDGVSSRDEQLQDPVTRHQKLFESNLAPKIYQRKFKHPPPLEVRSDDDEEESEEEAKSYDSEEDNNSSETSISESQEEDSRYVKVSSVRQRYNNRRSNTAATFEKLKESKLGTTTSRRMPTKSLQAKLKKQHNSKVQARVAISRILKSQPQKFKELAIKAKNEKSIQSQPRTEGKSYTSISKTPKRKFITRHERMISRTYPKRRPCKVFDFDFDDQGRKVIEDLGLNYHFKINKIQMPSKKVAEKKESKIKDKKVTPKARSKSRTSSVAKLSKREPSNTHLKKAGRPLSKNENSRSKSKKANPISSKGNGIQKQARRPNKQQEVSGTTSPAKHGLGHLFDIKHSNLKPLSKKEKASISDEYLAIRKIAEKEDLKEKPWGKFKFAVKKDPAHKFVKRERSREAEKYTKGQPIVHNMKSFGNLGWVPYEDDYTN